MCKNSEARGSWNTMTFVTVDNNRTTKNRYLLKHAQHRFTLTMICCDNMINMGGVVGVSGLQLRFILNVISYIW